MCTLENLSAFTKRGPAKILGVGDAVVTVKPHRQTFEVERYRAREKGAAQVAGDVVWNPDSGGSDTLAGVPSVPAGGTRGDDRLLFGSGWGS